MSASVWSFGTAFFVVSAVSVLHLRAVAGSLRLKVRLLERRERDLLETVGQLCEASRASSEDVLSVLERALREAAPGIDAVMVFETAGEELTPLRVTGERTQHFGAARYRLDGPPTPLTRAALEGHRAALCAGVHPLIPTDRGALAVPLGAGPTRGVVYVSTPKSREIQNADTVVRLIEQARAPFALAREREADRARATYDGLTGLLTARAFRALLAEEFDLARIAREGVLSLWFIDTDHFKPVNDTYGHGAGDLVLQRMAQLIGTHAHAGLDHVARNGGDEFCAIVKNVPKSSAIVRAQNLCEAVAAFDFGVDIRISASIGVATFPGDAASANELLEVADAAMYHTKRSGRNGVSFPIGSAAFERYAP